MILWKDLVLNDGDTKTSAQSAQPAGRMNTCRGWTTSLISSVFLACELPSRIGGSGLSLLLGTMPCRETRWTTILPLRSGLHVFSFSKPIVRAGGLRRVTHPKSARFRCSMALGRGGEHHSRGATRYAHMRRKRPPRRVWPGWQERAPGQLSALIPDDAASDLDLFEQSISRVGRGSAVFRLQKQVSPFGAFLSGLKADRRGQRDRHRRKILTWWISKTRSWRRRWRLEQELRTASFAKKNRIHGRRCKPDHLMQGHDATQRRTTELYYFRTCILCSQRSTLDGYTGEDAATRCQEVFPDDTDRESAHSFFDDLLSCTPLAIAAPGPRFSRFPQKKASG